MCQRAKKYEYYNSVCVRVQQYVMSTGTSRVLECNRSGSTAIPGALCSLECNCVRVGSFMEIFYLLEFAEISFTLYCDGLLILIGKC